MPERADVTIIGAGVVGAAIARELSALDLEVAVVESRHDVGDATSKANTAILHTGFDATPGTLESTLVSRGYGMLRDYAQVVGIPVEQTGAVLVAWTSEELAELPSLERKAAANGYTESAMVGPESLYRDVPALGPGALGGLTVPGESLICSWTTALAFATEAVERGAHLCLGCRVEGISRQAEHTVLHTTNGDLTSRWVVNVAGLASDVVDGWFGYQRFTVTPRRGELLVYDKQARSLVDRIVLPVPTSRGKGVLVAPTVYGNVMLGPTAEDRDDRDDTSTSETGLSFLLEKGATILPALLDEEVTAAYAGLRAATEHKDYVIDVDAAQRYAVVGGIRSTGLTASMAIAGHVTAALLDAGLDAPRRRALPEPPRMPNLGESFPRPYQRAELAATDGSYGQVVCFCERVTAGEIRDAFASTIPPTSLGGLRRRTRALNGRCQGFYCGAEVRRLFAAFQAGTGPSPATRESR
ncbi:MAG: NAD(P)/FAD-dependent oxidoreductase [Acidobacteriota bacterium]|nr:NAD(P)/FAD-dependent oxidoreductase [Acidobacteriota bacterium]